MTRVEKRIARQRYEQERLLNNSNSLYRSSAAATAFQYQQYMSMMMQSGAGAAEAFYNPQGNMLVIDALALAFAVILHLRSPLTKSLVTFAFGRLIRQEKIIEHIYTVFQFRNPFGHFCVSVKGAVYVGMWIVG